MRKKNFFTIATLLSAVLLPGVIWLSVAFDGPIILIDTGSGLFISQVVSHRLVLETQISGATTVTSHEYLMMPLWPLIIVFAALPVIWLIKPRPQDRRRLCQTCGYDLRASSGRCPECGSEFSPGG